MDSVSLIEKLKKYRKYVESFTSKNKDTIEDIHKIRVKSRELYSLTDQNDPFSKRIKKVIKLTNKIRDIDVFFEEYLHSLPKKIIKKLDLKSIEKYNGLIRAENIKKLHTYLSLFLDIPKSVNFIYKEKDFELENVDELEYDLKKLHKYRIYIKKRLYKEKNANLKNKKKIELLTTVKDILGTINDNHNGYKRLQTYNIEDSILKEIEDYTTKQNGILFNKFKTYNKELQR